MGYNSTHVHHDSYLQAMNSCILTAEIAQNPELRSTSDNQMEIAEMFVHFVNGKPENPPALIKVVGWNNLAREIKEKYRQGDRVVIEGRLEMSTIDKPEGYKEKRAQLVASRIHAIDGGDMFSAAPAPMASAAPAATPMASEPAATGAKTPARKAAPAPAPEPVPEYSSGGMEDNDFEIPF
jgi:single-strand DNA-binding protein